MIPRDHDALSEALRRGTIDDINDIIKLSRDIATAHVALSSLSSLGSSSTTVFTSCDNSTVTRPTSITTAYPPIKSIDKGKRKAKVRHASSLSGTHGSASEADVERRALRKIDLLEIGGWMKLTPSRPLKGRAQAKELVYRYTPLKQKKVMVDLTHDGDARTPLLRPDLEGVLPLDSEAGTVTGTLSQYSAIHGEDVLRAIEEGDAHLLSIPGADPSSFTRFRVVVLGILIILLALTITCASLGAYHTGKLRKSCTKGIVFTATALTAHLTILAMLVGRRPVLEALLAGLLELILGFTLLLQLDNFM